MKQMRPRAGNVRAAIACECLLSVCTWSFLPFFLRDRDTAQDRQIDRERHWMQGKGKTGQDKTRSTEQSRSLLLAAADTINKRKPQAWRAARPFLDVPPSPSSLRLPRVSRIRGKGAPPGVLGRPCKPSCPLHLSGPWNARHSAGFFGGNTRHQIRFIYVNPFTDGSVLYKGWRASISIPWPRMDSPLQRGIVEKGCAVL